MGTRASQEQGVLLVTLLHRGHKEETSPGNTSGNTLDLQVLFLQRRILWYSSEPSPPPTVNLRLTELLRVLHGHC